MHIQKQQLRDFRSCSWRNSKPNAAATCRLLQTITGLPDNVSVVSDEACAACCEMELPTVDHLNSVLASLVFAAASDVLQENGHPDCSAEKAHELLKLARTRLERVSSHVSDSVIPARLVQPCCYQGAPMPDLADGTSQFVCQHPQHNTANVHNCRRCRDWRREPEAVPLTLENMLRPTARRCKPQIRKWAVGVTTAPRRQPTLEACLDSLFRAGWENPHLFVDGGAAVPDRLRHLSATWRDRRLGAWSNYVLGLMELAVMFPDADAYLMIQDDAWFYDRENLREYLEQTLWPGDVPGIVSLYCSEADTGRFDGWHQHSGPWVWGALAFVFPRRVLERYIADPSLLQRPAQVVNGAFANVDSATGRWADSQKIPFWSPTPSLVQHIGNSSSIWSESANSGPRRADWFAADLDTAFHANSALDDFPEDEFPPAAKWQTSFNDTVTRGRRHMAAAKVVICGLCRDVRSCLPRTTARIKRLGNMFADYRVVLYENDSQDDTRRYLNSWAEANSAVTILSDSLGHTRFPQIRSLERAARLATYRNQYLDYVRDHYADYDYVIVADLDLRGGWSYDGIAHTFGHEHWDFIGSYGVLKRCQLRPNRRELLHFDSWAFRNSADLNPLTSRQVNEIRIERGASLIPVFSCFGGLGVYRTPAIMAASYAGTDCEHVVLHNAMRNAGFSRQFLNPAQLVIY